MESEDTDAKEERALDALLVRALLSPPSDAEIEKVMSGPDPELSPEEEALLDKMEKDLPGMVRGWRAAEEGTLLIKRERRLDECREGNEDAGVD
jgi:hypothetical protein